MKDSNINSSSQSKLEVDGVSTYVLGVLDP